MHKRIPIKNHQQEIQLVMKRTVLILVAICICVTILAVRLLFLQVEMHKLYSTLSTKNWLDLVPIEPTRGLIFDRNGVMLAENIPVFSLDIIPFKAKDLPNTLKLLSKIVSLNDNDVAQFQKQLKQHRRFDDIPLKLRLTEAEVARVVENQHRLPGVMIKARLIRRYPYGESFSHVLGYVGRINAQELNEIDQTNYSASHYIGKLGVEKAYEATLHGKVGYQQVENDASGKPIRVLREIKGIPGSNIYLTIDSKLQFAAEKAMLGRRGAVVAIDPQTGQVLAMVSKPGYDPNLFVLGISQKDYQALQQSGEKPLYNRALRGLYPPASTIKPFLALGGLEEGVVTPEFSLFDPGWFQLPKSSHLFHDSRRLGHGTVNLAKAIMSSCDIYFYDLANKMGINRISHILKRFGFGNMTAIDLEDELSGVVATPEWKLKIKGTSWYEGDTILSGIGQGFMQATPLQLAIATATLANRGKRFAPYLVLAKQLPDQPYVAQLPVPLDEITLINDQYWEVVIDAMQRAVNASQGTAHRRFGQNYRYAIAAKTGTAQVAKRRNPDEEDKQENLPEKLRDHHLFIAFAPVNKAKIALAVITENSNTAVETARIIFDNYLGNQQNVDRQSQNKVQKAAT